MAEQSDLEHDVEFLLGGAVDLYMREKGAVEIDLDRRGFLDVELNPSDDQGTDGGDTLTPYAAVAPPFVYFVMSRPPGYVNSKTPPS